MTPSCTKHQLHLCNPSLPWVLYSHACYGHSCCVIQFHLGIITCQIHKHSYPNLSLIACYCWHEPCHIQPFFTRSHLFCFVKPFSDINLQIVEMSTPSWSRVGITEIDVDSTCMSSAYGIRVFSFPKNLSLLYYTLLMQIPFLSLFHQLRPSENSSPHLL